MKHLILCIIGFILCFIALSLSANHFGINLIIGFVGAVLAGHNIEYAIEYYKRKNNE